MPNQTVTPVVYGLANKTPGSVTSVPHCRVRRLDRTGASARGTPRPVPPG